MCNGVITSVTGDEIVIHCSNFVNNGTIVPKPSIIQQTSKKRSSMKLFRTYANGDHNSTWQRGGAQYYDDIAEFVTLVMSRQEDRQP